ncbi:MAG: hypothetical protein RMI34_05975 [Chloroherpetonaceae bacterium]|nr:hypothetical protein [Chloroherpetonaceae bacterium]MCS7212148.1 hypothetical protein [Chloroherpetonaceae bacterium]MDW8019607.1 hypothetical protein [Chloroherpetonaceae bacterium]MDW8466658.1 hypothetical protein [Chloroherpetonaceae bacterium]
MRYALLLSLLLTASSLYAQLGTLPSVPKKETAHPQGLPTTSIKPSILSREDKPDIPAGFESVSPVAYPGLEPPPVPQVTPTSLAAAAVKPTHLTMMSGIGYGFGRGYGLGSASRIGVTLPSGLYLGTTGLFSIGTDLVGMPFTASSGTLANHSLGLEVGLEIPLKIFGGALANRFYAGAGLLLSNLTFRSGSGDFWTDDPWLDEFIFSRRPPQWYYGPNPLFGSWGSFQNNQVFFQGQILFYSVGNLFYYKLPELGFLRNLLIGLDARYVFVGNLSGFLALPTIGIYY